MCSSNAARDGGSPSIGMLFCEKVVSERHSPSPHCLCGHIREQQTVPEGQADHKRS